MDSPFLSLVGGILIGIAASLLLYWTGRVAGVSGIVKGLVPPVRGDVAWRLAFLGGLLVGGLLLKLFFPGALMSTLTRDPAVVALAGLLVGFGTALGGGCTSGHGVCGVSRLAPRSLVATVVFVAFGMLTATVFRIYLAQLFGGPL